MIWRATFKEYSDTSLSSFGLSLFMLTLGLLYNFVILLNSVVTKLAHRYQHSLCNK